MAVGKAGAKNAGILAAQILALDQPALHKKLWEYKKGLAVEVEEPAKKITKK
jgi:phosphoribosylcarboxyaminoimidazole (NCAIR) mutase